MSPKSPEERYQEWLDRMEIPIEQQTDIDTLRKYLKDEFGITGDAQVAALWDTIGVSDLLSEYGIHAVTVTYPWGRELRYGVQGLAGLWGWAAVQGIIAAEAYE
jgi:hypothetical protein